MSEKVERQKKISRIATITAIQAATFAKMSPFLSRRLEPSAGTDGGRMFACSAIIDGSAEG
jgi:hypothetical protein